MSEQRSQRQDGRSPRASQPTAANSAESAESTETLRLFPGANGSALSERGEDITVAAPSHTGRRGQHDPPPQSIFRVGPMQEDEGPKSSVPPQSNRVADADSDAPGADADVVAEQAAPETPDPLLEFRLWPSSSAEQAQAHEKGIIERPSVAWRLPVPVGHSGGIFEMLELRLGEPPSSAPVNRCVADLALLRSLGGNLGALLAPPAGRSSAAPDASPKCWACMHRSGCVEILRASLPEPVFVCMECHLIGCSWYADWKQKKQQQQQEEE